jgi:Zinc knuckle
MDQRKNTIKVQLPSQNEKPLDSEMLRWVIVDLGLKDDEIVGLGQNPMNDGIMYIKCVSEIKMKEIIEKFDGTTFKYLNGIAVRVTMTEASENIRYVRIFGLPFEVEDEHIEGFFRSFGIVKRLVKEKYPSHYNFNVLSGVRGVYIDLKKEIPSFLYMRGVRVKIHYYGMKEKCHICGSPDHMRSECPSKPVPIETPAARLNLTTGMQNLNTLFKRPFGPPSFEQRLTPLGIRDVSPGPNFATGFAGNTASVISNENQAIVEQQQNVSTVEKPTLPIVVTVTNTDADIGTVDGSTSTTTQDVVVGEPKTTNELGWQRVMRSSRSRSKNPSPGKTERVRTDSSSSAASISSTRGRGRPPSKKTTQMVIQHIADNDEENPDNSTALQPEKPELSAVLPNDTADEQDV